MVVGACEYCVALFFVKKFTQFVYTKSLCLWSQGNKESAVLTLEKALAADFPAKSRFLTPDQNVHLPEEKRIVCAQVIHHTKTFFRDNFFCV